MKPIRLLLFALCLALTTPLTALSQPADPSEARPSAAELRWQQMSPEQRAELRQQFEHFRQLPPERQQLLRERLRHFRQMPPEKQDELRRRYHRWRDLPPERQERLRRQFHRFQSLPEETQHKLRLEMQKLRELPPEERRERRRELRQRYFDQEQPSQPDAPPRRHRTEETPARGSGGHGPRH